MKELDIEFYFGFNDGCTAEDYAYGIEFSDSLYNKLKEIYQIAGENYLDSIEETIDEGNCFNLTEKQAKELRKTVSRLREDLIDLQHYNGNDVDPDTGDEIDFSGLIVNMVIVVPEDWENTDF